MCSRSKLRAFSKYLSEFEWGIETKHVLGLRPSAREGRRAGRRPRGERFEQAAKLNGSPPSAKPSDGRTSLPFVVRRMHHGHPGASGTGGWGQWPPVWNSRVIVPCASARANLTIDSTFVSGIRTGRFTCCHDGSFISGFEPPMRTRDYATQLKPSGCSVPQESTGEQTSAERVVCSIAVFRYSLKTGPSLPPERAISKRTS